MFSLLLDCHSHLPCFLFFPQWELSTKNQFSKITKRTTRNKTILCCNTIILTQHNRDQLLYGRLCLLEFPHQPICLLDECPGRQASRGCGAPLSRCCPCHETPSFRSEFVDRHHRHSGDGVFYNSVPSPNWSLHFYCYHSILVAAPRHWSRNKGIICLHGTHHVFLTKKVICFSMVKQLYTSIQMDAILYWAFIVSIHRFDQLVPVVIIWGPGHPRRLDGSMCVVRLPAAGLGPKNHQSDLHMTGHHLFYHQEQETKVGINNTTVNIRQYVRYMYTTF